jgi:hypothetical protein
LTKELDSNMHQDDSWRLAMWVEAKREKFGDDGHRPAEMRSGQSHGPLMYWICDICQTGIHSTSTIPPVCYG